MPKSERPKHDRSNGLTNDENNSLILLIEKDNSVVIYL